MAWGEVAVQPESGDVGAQLSQGVCDSRINHNTEHARLRGSSSDFNLNLCILSSTSGGRRSGRQSTLFQYLLDVVLDDDRDAAVEGGDVGPYAPPDAVWGQAELGRQVPLRVLVLAQRPVRMGVHQAPAGRLLIPLVHLYRHVAHINKKISKRINIRDSY
eukprot:1182787-Prorocentrum_minimum.AAC.6